MRCSVLHLALVASGVTAFPFVLNQPGVDSRLLRLGKRQQAGEGAGSEALCPYNPPEDHVPAIGISAEFPYNGAQNGSAGMGKGGFLVPAEGDTAHQFQAPRPGIDVRGPCPGLNAAANHGFLARDGIVTFQELTDAQQNVYNVGFDLAVLLATLGVTTGDGDPTTMKLSIGCDATNRTSVDPLLTGSEPGLAGHDKFEADASLTRNDFFTSDGDDFHANSTLFGMMVNSTGGNFGQTEMSEYRLERYNQSRAENPNFYFSPFALLLYGASAFVYELMPSGTHDYAPDLETISTFFGMEQDGSDWTFTGNESIPANWTNRLTPFSILDAANEIRAQYQENPVAFGGNTGNGGFDLISFGSGNSSITDGMLTAPDAATVACLLYQLATERVPSSLNGVITPSVTTLAFVLSQLDPVFANLGCPEPLT